MHRRLALVALLACAGDAAAQTKPLHTQTGDGFVTVDTDAYGRMDGCNYTSTGIFDPAGPIAPAPSICRSKIVLRDLDTDVASVMGDDLAGELACDATNALVVAPIGVSAPTVDEALGPGGTIRHTRFTDSRIPGVVFDLEQHVACGKLYRRYRVQNLRATPLNLYAHGADDIDVLHVTGSYLDDYGMLATRDGIPVAGAFSNGVFVYSEIYGSTSPAARATNIGTGNRGEFASSYFMPLPDATHRQGLFVFNNQCGYNTQASWDLDNNLVSDTPGDTTAGPQGFITVAAGGVGFFEHDLGWEPAACELRSDAGPDSTATITQAGGCAATITLDGSASQASAGATYEWTDEHGTVVGTTPVVLVTTISNAGDHSYFLKVCLPIGSCDTSIAHVHILDPSAECLCGNGVIDAGETCDDGNRRNADGCSIACAIEPGYTCVSAPSVCSIAPPVIGKPVDGASTNVPTISGTGVPGATVTVTEGATTVCTATVATNGTWTCSAAALPDGPHTIVATESDAFMHTSGPSNTVTFTLDRVPPVVTIGTPDTVQPGNQAAFPVSGMCEAGAGDVTITVGALTITTPCLLGGTYATTIDTTTLPEAAVVTIVATQTDAAGNVGTATANPPRACNATHAPACTAMMVCNPTSQLCESETPAPVITSPTNHGTTRDHQPPISGTGIPGATVTVTDTGPAGTGGVVCTAVVAANGTWTCTPGAPLGDGDHRFSATQTPPGKVASGPSVAVNVTIDGMGPKVSIDDGPTVTATDEHHHRITGTCDPTAGDVTLTVGTGDAAITTSVPCASNGTFEVFVDVPAGDTIPVTATQTDPAGNVGTATRTLTREPGSTSNVSTALAGGGWGCSASGAGAPGSLPVVAACALALALGRRRRRARASG